MSELTSITNEVAKLAIRYDWIILKQFVSLDALEDYLIFKLPYNKATSSRRNEVYCQYDESHKVDIQRRECLEESNNRKLEQFKSTKNFIIYSNNTKQITFY